jgi:hypothetical protein
MHFAGLTEMTSAACGAQASGHEHAAIDVQLLAGHIGSLRTGQIGHGVCNVSWFAEVPQRNLAQQGLLLLFGQGSGHVGFDESQEPRS